MIKNVESTKNIDFGCIEMMWILSHVHACILIIVVAFVVVFRAKLFDSAC